MPCSLQPWEVEIENRRANIRDYGIDLADRDLLTRLLCESCQFLTPLQWEHGASEELTLWWKAHKIIDAKKEAMKS